MQSKATTVLQYLNELPEDRRAVISAVRDVIIKNLDSDFEEGMQYGMIGYFVPHHLYPSGYHCDPRQPLPFACLASQKNYMSLYVMSLYGDETELKLFRDEWAKTGKKLDMGKSCIRFRKLDDLALELIGKAIGRVNASKYIDACEAALAKSKSPTQKQVGASKKAVAKKAPTKKTARKNTVRKKR